MFFNRQNFEQNKLGLYVFIGFWLVIGLLPLLQSLHWFFELLQQLKFVFLFLIILASITSIFTDKNRKTALMIFASIVAVSALQYYKYYQPPWVTPENINSETKTPEKTLRIFYANIFAGNSNYKKLMPSLLKNDYDLIMLLEVTPQNLKLLSELHAYYPHSNIHEEDGNFGYAVFSKLPVLAKRELVFTKNKLPALFLELDTAGENIYLGLLHAFPPIGSDGTRLRNRYLSASAEAIGQAYSRKIICGDLNTTPWTRSFKLFLKKSKLEKADTIGVFNTWPQKLVGPLQIPIDHCFTEGMKLISSKKGPDIGSDHYPLIFEVAL